MQWDPMWGFQFLLILDLLSISFHAVVVFGLGKNLLFKSILGRCVSYLKNYLKSVPYLQITFDLDVAPFFSFWILTAKVPVTLLNIAFLGYCRETSSAGEHLGGLTNRMFQKDPVFSRKRSELYYEMCSNESKNVTLLIILEIFFGNCPEFFSVCQLRNMQDCYKKHECHLK